MIVNADLHIHSRFSGATSDKMNIKTISLEAPRKGVDVVGTGDCLHGGWMDEIKQCNLVEEGTFELNKTRFILSTEVEALGRVHHLLFFPGFSSVIDFKERIKSKSKNLETDGRPNVSMTGEELAQVAKDLDALIGPAHAFTPYTSMYACYDSLKDCYGSMVDYVSFVELGLSADSSFADKIQELHRLTFLTNSDCHSPHPVRLGREFNRFQVKEPSYNEIKKAILRKDGNKPVLNVGLPPQEGKYHETACSRCYIHYEINDAMRRKWKCGCGGRIKKGVKDNINEKADFAEPCHPDHRPEYVYLIPLAEIITKAVGQRNPFTQTVTKRFNELVDVFGSEINVMLEADINKISRVTAPAITQAIQAFRDKKVIVIPGGGGEYGKIKLPDDETIKIPIMSKDVQTSLADYCCCRRKKVMDYKKAENDIKKIIQVSSNVLQDVADYLCTFVNHYNWVGIYIVEGENLILGPWEGPHATDHTVIPIGKGVCGSAAATGKTEIVDDVNSDDRYLACFVSTKSEIVVPIKRQGKIVAEIDIDSDKIAAFTKDDKVFLEKIADMLSVHI
jgi:uncharacterized protein (TIGR00375 family)